MPLQYVDVATQIGTLAGVGGIGLMLRGAFRGVTEQWRHIFDTQTEQIKELREQVHITREQAAEDRVRLETQAEAAKLAEKACQDDYSKLRAEMHEVRKELDVVKGSAA